MPKLFLALLLVTFCNLAFGADWRQYQSENFTVYSDHSPKTIKRLINDFEVFRKAALLFFGLEDRPENQHAKIYVFSSKREYGLLDLGTAVAGFYLHTFEGPLMVIGSQRKIEDNYLVLFHEYVHYLTRERSRLMFPKWYDEGVSDILGAAKVEGGSVIIGNSNRWRLRRSSRGARIAVEDLIKPPERISYKYRAYFYPSSWVLTHYLYFSSLYGDKDYSAPLKHYLLAYQKGDNTLETFENILGIDVKKLDEKVDQHSRKEAFKGFKIPIGQYQGRFETRSLSTNEAIYVRSKLLLNLDEEYKARYFLKKSDEKAEFAAVNSALYAVSEAAREHFDLAQEKMAFALKAAPNNLEVQSLNIHYNALRLKHMKEEDTWDSNIYNEAVAEAQQTIKKLRLKDQAKIYLSEIYRLNEQHKDALQLMMEVYQNHRRNLSLNQKIALYLIDIEKPQLAKDFLLTILNFSHSKEQREDVEELMEELDIS